MALALLPLDVASMSGSPENGDMSNVTGTELVGVRVAWTDLVLVGTRYHGNAPELRGRLMFVSGPP